MNSKPAARASAHPASTGRAAGGAPPAGGGVGGIGGPPPLAPRASAAIPAPTAAVVVAKKAPVKVNLLFCFELFFEYSNENCRKLLRKSMQRIESLSIMILKSMKMRYKSYD